MFIAKIIFLFVAILLSISIGAKAINRNGIKLDAMVIDAIAWTGFITIQWLL